MFKYSILYNSSLKNLNLLVVVIGISVACNPSGSREEAYAPESNPAAQGFDSLNSDQKAIEWADAVMTAMGGRKKWDQTRYLYWNFFDRRDLWWDKYTGDVRIESPKDSIIYLINVNTNEGKVSIAGNELMEPDTLKYFLNRAKSIWINDSYWLVMPFKLKDSGVTLKYLGEDTTINGQDAHVLELTFNNVGDTPENKYEIYITQEDSLVKQWAYFDIANQDSASVIWPWDNYKNYNGLKLSSDRSDNKGPHNVQVYDSLDSKVFTSFSWKP